MPQLRGATKNQSRSFMIGPPRVADISNSFSVLFDAVRPAARSSSLRLLPSRLSFVYRAERAVRNWLLPSFGMMFTTRPSALVSAEMPLVDMTISSTDAELS